jgi:hypothetical protein
VRDGARAAALTLAATALGLTAACGRVEPAPPGTPPSAGNEQSPGERAAQTAHYELRVLRVEDCRAGGLGAPANGARRLGLEIVLTPTSDVQVPANPYYARLLDEHRQIHDATLGACGAPLSPSLPRRGESARGFIVFDVPRGSRRLTLLYMPELVGAPKEEASIELGQP